MKLKVRASELQPGDRFSTGEVISRIERANHVRINIEKSYVSYLKKADTLLEIERDPETIEACKARGRAIDYYGERFYVVAIVPIEETQCRLIGWMPGGRQVWHFANPTQRFPLWKD